MNNQESKRPQAKPTSLTSEPRCSEKSKTTDMKIILNRDVIDVDKISKIGALFCTPSGTSTFVLGFVILMDNAHELTVSAEYPYSGRGGNIHSDPDLLASCREEVDKLMNLRRDIVHLWTRGDLLKEFYYP